MCEYGDVRMIGYVQVEMCEWSGHNVQVNMKCTSRVMLRSCTYRVFPVSAGCLLGSLLNNL